MRKIVVGAQVSLDGVMQAPGGPTEDPTGGFKYGGWSMPYFDETAGEEIARLFAQPFDLLLGRKTYEIFAAYWPYYDEAAPAGGIARRFNEITKYVVSASGEVDTGWQGTVRLAGVDDIKRLRAEDGPALITQGSTRLIHALFAADLVDTLSLFTVPVVLGGGKALFEPGAAPHAYTLTASRASASGVTIAHYERGGEVRTSDTAQDQPSKAEMARRQRMQREG